MKELTLQDTAELWWKEQDKVVPERNTLSYKRMYNRWIMFAFEDFHDSKNIYSFECEKCGELIDIDKNEIGKVECTNCDNKTVFTKL